MEKLKGEFNTSLNHVQHVLRLDVDYTWECTVRNEQYSRKNNLRIIGLEEHAD